MPPKQLDIVTHSELQTVDTCKRQGFLQYQLGLRPTYASTPLRMGSAVHYGLHLKKAKVPLKCTILEQVLSEYDKSKPAGLSEEQEYKWEIERTTIAAMLNCYDWRWAEQDETIKYLTSELSFQMPITNPATSGKSKTFILAGVIDAIVELPDGRLAIMEHKTCGQDIDIEADYWKQLRIDSQISLYFMAAKYLGYNVETIIYDVLRKPTIKPYKATPDDKRKYKKDGQLYANMRDRDETPDEFGKRFVEDIGVRPDFYYMRREIPRITEDMEEFKYELWQKTQVLRECKKHNRWYRNTKACIGMYKCGYFDLCTTGYDITSRIAPQGFEFVDDVHPELELRS